MASNFHIGNRKFILELRDYKAGSFHLCTTMLPNLQALSGFMRNIWKHGLEKEVTWDLENISCCWFLSPQNGMLLLCHLDPIQHKQDKQWMCSVHPRNLGVSSLSLSPLSLYLSFSPLFSLPLSFPPHPTLSTTSNTPKEVNISYSIGSLRLWVDVFCLLTGL